MGQIVKGTVTRVGRKGGTGKNGKPYTLFSAQISGFDKFLNFGFKDPGLSEGDVIEVDGDYHGDRGFNVQRHRVTGKEAVPAPAARGQSAPSGGSRDDYWKQKEVYDKEHTQPRIQYQNARSHALQFLEILATQDGLPITAAAGKANKAKRYEELKEILDKLTVEFYHDTNTLRVLDRVEDAGSVEETPVAPLPTAEPTMPEETWTEDPEDGEGWQ